jgi:putative membrane protein
MDSGRGHLEDKIMANPNDWSEDDDRIGVPFGRIAAPVQAEPHTTASDTDDAELRPGETELGRPPQVPRNLTPLSEDDRRRLRQAEEEQAARELAEAEELLASDPAVFRWAGVFAHPLAAAFLVGMIGVLGLFLFSQVVSLLNGLAGQPDWVRYVGYTGLTLLSLCVLYAMLRLAGLYFRLRRNRQIRLAGLQELSNRTRLRWLAHAKSAEAKARLEDYLRTFPLETPRDRRVLERVGVTAEMAADLRKVRDELLDPVKFASSDQWFRQFRDGFQAKLDEAADARVKYWAKRTGIVTAIAPNALVDSLATTYFGFAMLADLCKVYNLRAGRTGTAVLLSRVFFNAYLAGQLTEWERLTEEQINQLFIPGGPLYELAAARVISKVGTKAAGGVLNYFLLARLGRYGCRLLRPVAAE